jgi:hypothetical protein
VAPFIATPSGNTVPARSSAKPDTPRSYPGANAVLIGVRGLGQQKHLSRILIQYHRRVSDRQILAVIDQGFVISDDL